MATDQQPEEAAAKPLAAAGSFAGSLAQTSIYGRFRQQPGSAITTQPRQAVVSREQPKVAASSAPKPDLVLREPAGNAGAELAEPVLASDVLVAASAQDTAAAQARMARSQLPEPPAAAPAAPVQGPVL